MTKAFLIEFLILVIHPFPYYEQSWTMNIIDMSSKADKIQVTYLIGEDFLFAWLFLRVYFLMRTMLNFSVFSDLYAKRVCVKYGFQ